MKEIWKTIKALLGWIIGVSSVLAGITSFFDTYGVMPKIFGGILILVGLYIIPKIYNYLNFGIKIKHIVITYLIGLIGLALTIDNKPPKPVDKNTFYITASTLNIRKGEGKQFEVLYKLNKVNPVGGKFDLNSIQGRKKFFEVAEKVADKYKLPREFEEVLF